MIIVGSYGNYSFVVLLTDGDNKFKHTIFSFLTVYHFIISYYRDLNYKQKSIIQHFD